MNAMFAPAVGLMNRFKYPYKFAAIGILSLIAIGFLFFSLASQLRVGAEASRKELQGIDVIKPVMELIRQTQQHRGLTSGALGGNAALRDKVPGKQEEVSAAIKKVDAVAAGLGEQFGFAAEWGDIKTDWEAIRTSWERTTISENLKAHGALVERLLAMEVLVSETSGLILDPDLDSYYLMDTITRVLPDSLERLGKLRAAGTGVLGLKEIKDRGRIEFSARVSVLEKAMDEIRHNTDRAGKANPALKKRLDDFAGKFEEMTGGVASVITNEIALGRFETPANVFFDRATQAIDLGYEEMRESLFPALIGLLDARIAGFERQFMLHGGIAILMILAFAYLAIGAYMSIMASIGQLGEGADRLSNGDLGTRVELDAEDELKIVAERFNGMATTFSELIGRVQDNASRVAQAAAELSASSDQVAKGSELQSESASNMAASVEEMTVSIDELAKNAQQARELSERSGALSQQGGEIVGKTAQGMESIARTVNDSAGTIEDLGRQSQQINAIVNVIKDIADQTNLLALNAAIEAARAGEAGRGFAVVADEVRKLAERTGKSTQEIAEMVAAIQSGTGRAVESMQGGVERVREGVSLANQAGASMEQISASAAEVVRVVSDISAALREQGVASTDIARNVERIAQMAEENNAAVSGTAATARELEALAQGLQAEMGRFRVR